MRFPPRLGTFPLIALGFALTHVSIDVRAEALKPLPEKPFAESKAPSPAQGEKGKAKTDNGARSGSTEPDHFMADVRPLLSKYCVGCHGATKPKAGLNLVEMLDPEIAAKKRKVWSRVRESLEGSLMPPEGKKQPTPEEVASLGRWLDATEEKVDCVKSVDPGRVTMRRLNRVEYRNTVRDLTGVDFHTEEDFPSDDVGSGFDNIGEVLTLPPILMEKYMAAASTIAERAIAQDLKGKDPAKILFRRPKSAAENQDAAREILERFARRAYRTSVTGGEVARLVKLCNLVIENGDSFESGIQLAVQATLVSPRFLFRVELLNSGRRFDRNRRTPKSIDIGDFELASRLSYFLWSTMPDEMLFDLAREDKLSEPKVLEAQVRRMLADPKAQALVENFAGQWLQLRMLRTIQPAREKFPNFDESLRSAMIQETELFFASILKDDRSVAEFLDADYTFLNERLAAHYGITGVKGAEFRRVPVSADQRGGLVSQASILTVTSNPTRTSPVKRGKWILEQIFGTPPPPPPPNVPELEDDQKNALTGSLRQRMEQHRANPSCASCHAKMDPLGFGLENYDAIGGWRLKDSNILIDSSGTLPSGQSFKGPKELKAILKAKKSDFVRNLSEKLLIYSIGRSLEDYDSCSVDQIVKAVESDGDRFSRLILEIVRSEPFQKRRT